MLYQKATVENGQIKILSTKEVDQASLTSDCWLVQIEGLKACKTCDTSDCGGGEFLKSLKRKVSKSRIR